MKEIYYKGYKVSLNENAKDERIYARIMGISDFVVCKIENQDHWEEECKKCVDLYLKECDKVSKIPEKTYNPLVEVSVDMKYQRILNKEASRKKCTLQDLISNILKQYVDFISC